METQQRPRRRVTSFRIPLHSCGYGLVSQKKWPGFRRHDCRFFVKQVVDAGTSTAMDGVD